MNKEKLVKLQQKYSLKIKQYLESLKEFEGCIIKVNFNIDYELNEYFIIYFDKDTQLILKCEQIPYLRLYNNTFKCWYDLKNIDNVLHRLASNQCIYINLIEIAEEYYIETQKILDE